MPPPGSGIGRSSNSSGVPNDRRITARMRQQRLATALTEVDAFAGRHMRPGAVREPREEIRRLESEDRLYTKGDKDEEHEDRGAASHSNRRAA
jgi:hypothetical protein